jgi:O-Antigen ligase
MHGYRASRFPLEPLAGLLVALLTGCMLVATSDVETKYKLAAIAAVAGFAVLAAFPERRAACVALWVLIHPMSVEKIFLIDAAEGPQFTDPTIALNASDGPLALLALFLVAETISSGRIAFRWSRLTTIMLVFLIWSTVSFGIHATYLNDGFVTSTPVTLLQDVRLLVFVLLIQSAIRTRGEVILVLLAVGAAVMLQAVIVGLSYSTGRVFSYGAATVASGAASLQGFDTFGGGELLRATGTVGQVNEQAQFHTFMTIPLIAFFVVRSGCVRCASVAAVAVSALALVLTFSRGAWLAFPIGLTVCCLVAFRHQLIQRTAILIGAMLMVGAAIALLFLAEPIYQRLAFGDTGATASRLRMMTLAADLFEAYPLIGVGPGEFDEAALRLYPPGFEQNQWIQPGEKLPYTATTIGRVEIEEMRAGRFFLRRPLPVHNKYLLTLSELGLPGLAIWLWFCLELIRPAWQCSKFPDRFLSLLGIAGLGVTAAQLVYTAVDLFHEDKPLEIMLFVPAMILAASRVALRDSGALLRPLPRPDCTEHP